MADRLRRDALAALIWMATFVVVGAVLGLALLTMLDDLILRASAVGYVVNAIVTAVSCTAGALLARRYPQPDGVVPEPRWVLLGGPLLVAVLSVAGSPAWDAALGAAVALGASAALLAGDRPDRVPPRHR